MTGPGPRLTDVPPAAREAVGLVERDPHAPTKLLVTGGIGTGKSTVLAALRQLLRAAGRAVLSRPPRPGDTEGAAVLIDDADLLETDDVDRVTALVAEPAATVVIGAQPLAHHAALRRLFLALERENLPVALGPLTPVDVGRMTAAALGEPAAADTVRMLVAAAAGLPFLLRPAIGSVGEGNRAVRQAARFALVERLHRLDEPLLDTLLVSSLAPGLGPDDVAAGLRMTPDEARGAVDRARAGGLLDPFHPPGFARDVHDAVASIVGAAHHHDVEVSILTSQVATSTLTPELALQLAEHGLRDERLAAALTELAGQDTVAPARAARLYRAAARAGDSVPAVHLADALALTGDCATAARLADDMLTSSDTADRAGAVRIAASIALHDGNSAQARDLFAWLGSAPDAFEDPTVGAAATISAMAAGDAAAARAGTDAPRSGPPTSAARAARAVTDGLVLTLDAPYPVALTRLSQAIGTDANPPVVTPDTPAALVTLAALHGGDPVRARSVIGRAVREGSDRDGDHGSDAIFVTYRHRLLHGWTLMQDGHLQAAAAAAAAAPGQHVHRRDALWAAALQTAIARRGGDTGAMQQHWYAAMEVLAECATDLFSLLPLGELWTAAARMRQVDRLRHAVDQAFEVLAGLGNPVLWSVPLHWAGVHAGILANSPGDVAPHGQALTAAAAHSTMAKVLATAGRTWLRVLADAVDTDEVAAAARGLAHVGHTSDATRLAGQAALHTTDPRVSQAMLQLARDLKQAVAAPEAPVDSDDPRPSSPPARTRSAATLSEREREVAELLLQGLPYRDIGAQLFISAKTVEHHVARIRRRLGAESRSEMLSMLRVMLAPAT
ncbi:isoniazid response ATPase/transcriptional regulator IniR [Mycobacterium sp. PSTR-4-N]|uniref:isoniazid response ATPase/transcriptional regulator IniR n=1 Tax=Mycobacterium sp. PSTR-4-N TaxID=2917745 RepID=UPI001F154C13|nr:isoniazid response ATPase/transcriptional regulator IniR [Mycobacterium sp. PSTR-4-N]MCG7595525.1 isoniazid response ATPase/transcriptional regulator IniR [Mycobacterium sp. PSTR-4-N]